MELNGLTIKQAHEGLKKKEFSSVELTKACLDRIKKVDKKLNSFITKTKDKALVSAELADQKIKKAKEEINILEGIPVCLKDNILVRGVKCTAASKILEDYNAVYDATVAKKLRDRGMALLGKTNMDEFAMGSSNETSYFGSVKNPWDLKRVSGGSSGGSVVSVSTDEAIFALGSDTGGSIRQPASFCGVVGLKPTYGRVSRNGLMAMASSLDQIGPITKNVEDAALVLKEIAGHDKDDSTTVFGKEEEFLKDLKKDIKGLKIGVPKEYFIEGMDEGTEKTVKEAIKKLEALGAKIEEVSLPYSEYALAVYYIIMPAEVSANLARYDGVRYGFRAEAKDLIDTYLKTRSKGFGDEVIRRIMLGTYSLSAGYYDAYYLKAQKVRTLIKKDFEKVFKKVDCLAAPTTPAPAFKIGEKFDDPLTMYLADIFTVSLNVSGLPGISVPCGFSGNLPVGLQIIGNYFDEKTILRVANNYEQATEWHKKKPGL